MLRRRLLFRILLRSFLLQASWNFERMQSLGVVYVLAPALRVFYQGDELARAYGRHLAYFNTHPYLASPIMGTVLSLEEGGRNDAQSITVEDFKTMIMAPYAAMGDAFFWGGVRPLAACVGVYFAVLGKWWAPLLFLVLFNVPHLLFRVVGLFGGYALGLGVTELIQRLRLPDMAIRCKQATVLFLGGLSAYLVVQGLRGEELWAGWGLAAIPLVIVLGWLGSLGVSNLMLILTFSALLLLFYR